MRELALRNRLARFDQRIEILEGMIEDRAREIYLAHERLADAATFMQEVYRTMPGALVVTDPQRRISAINASAVRLFEYPEHELVGQPVAMLFDDNAFVADGGEPRPWRSEQTIRTRSGEVIPVLFSAIWRAGGGAICIALDIRERKRLELELLEALAATQRELADRQRAEEERERLREQLLHSQKLEAIGTLAGGVAHDMNNILAGIVGLAEYARDGAHGDLRDDLDQIIEAAQQGASLTRNLLGFSRRGAYERRLLRLDELLAGAARLMSRTLPRGIAVTTRFAPDVAVEGDRSQLTQAVINLCLNACDAMGGSGSLVIGLAEIDLDPVAAGGLDVGPGRYAEVTVTDTGCGMTPALRGRIFEPFFTTKDAGRGTGLGLAMVYGTITHHGGAVDVDSEPGRGTTMRVLLPVAQAPTADEQAEHVVGTARSSGLLLVVDDEPVIRSVTQRTLERVGYQVLTAHHGRDALEQFARRSGEISLVLLDMEMPVMNGADCFFGLRALNPRLPVLLASGFAPECDARRCLDNGASGFLHKPVTSERLLDAVAEALAATTEVET